MHRLVSVQTGFVAMLLLSSVCVAATYRWVDKDGVVHYSDRPVAGAQEVQLRSAPMPGTVVPTPIAPAASADTPSEFRYSQCAVTTPMVDQVYNNVNSVGVSVNLSPGLREGDRIEVQLDGVPVTAWPATSTSYFLNNVFRGSHGIVAVVRDSTGRALCTSPVINFHVTQPSVLAPARG
ncbi:MAG: DUF4124 domain-containing protein [Steroidobacteraceae bacterium]